MPVETIDFRKRSRLTIAASQYLASHRATEKPCRFDVIGVDLSTTPPTISLIKDAFQT